MPSSKGLARDSSSKGLAGLARDPPLPLMSNLYPEYYVVEKISARQNTVSNSFIRTFLSPFLTDWLNRPVIKEVKNQDNIPQIVSRIKKINQKRKSIFF